MALMRSSPRPSSPAMSFSGDDDDVQFISAHPPLPPLQLGLVKSSAITLTVESGDVAQRRTFQRANTKTVIIGRVTAEHAPRFANHPSQAAFVCPVMSRQHARISFAENGQVFIVDLESHHGTVIARGGDQPVYIHLVPTEKYTLHDNDLVTFGKTVYKQGIPHDPVSVRVSLVSSAAVSTSPGPIRYGLFESSESEDESSDDMDSPEEPSFSDNTPPGNQLGLPCLALPAPAPVLPSISSFSMPIPSFWSCGPDQVDPRSLHPIAPQAQHTQHQPEILQVSMPTAVPMVPPPPSVAAVVAQPDDTVLRSYQQQVDELKHQFTESFSALQEDIGHLRADAAGARGDEWERLRASVRADFPDGLRDRVAELENGLKRLNETLAALGDVGALRTELASSNAEVAALKTVITTIEARAQNAMEVDVPTSSSPRKRKRTDDNEDDERVSRPTVVKRIRQSAPLVVVGAAAMYIGLCAL